MAKAKFYAEPGTGQGAGKEKVGDGGRDDCYCPVCKKTYAHDRGMPCIEQTCPDCGGKLQPATEFAESSIALPASHPKVTDKKDHYPLADANQARNALARASQYDASPPWFDGTLVELKNIVRAAVKKAFPEIEVTMSEFMAFAEVQTWNDLRNELDKAVREKYPRIEATEGEAIIDGAWVTDVMVTERSIIIRGNDGEYFKQTYDLDNEGNIVLGSEEIPMSQEWIQTYSEEIETIDINDVDLFMGGTPSTMEYTEEDITQMVSDYNELSEEIKPPVFLGHTRRLGWPAVGTVKNLKQQGMKIIGDLKKVPMKIAKYINSGGYFRGSAEIQPTYHSEAGKDYKDVFYGFGILGQDVPVLKLMRDLPIPVYSEGPETQVYQFAVTAKTITTHGGEEAMTEKSKSIVEVEAKVYAELVEDQKKVKGLEDQQAKINEYAEVIKTQKTEKEGLEKKVKDFSEEIAGIRADSTKAKIDAKIDVLKKAGDIEPAAERKIRDFAESQDDSKLFAEGEEGSQLDRYLSQLEKPDGKKATVYSEKSTKGKERKEFSEDDSDLDKRAKVYAEKNGVPYDDALSEVYTESDEENVQERIH